jgi:phosphoribosylanthranilate isomerase
MHKPKLYATQVQHLTDARYFAAQGVDIIGLNIEKGNKEALTPEQFKEIKNWLAGVEVSAELGSFTQIEAAQELLKNIEVKNVTLPYIVPPVGLKDDGSDYHIIHKLIIQPHVTSGWGAMREMAKFYKDLTKSDVFFIDLSAFGDFILDMNIINELKFTNSQFNCYFMFDMPNTNLKRILNRLPLYGLGVRGEAEEKLGVKSFDQLNDFFDMLNE